MIQCGIQHRSRGSNSDFRYPSLKVSNLCALLFIVLGEICGNIGLSVTASPSLSFRVWPVLGSTADFDPFPAVSNTRCIIGKPFGVVPMLTRSVLCPLGLRCGNGESSASNFLAVSSSRTGLVNPVGPVTAGLPSMVFGTNLALFSTAADDIIFSRLRIKDCAFVLSNRYLYGQGFSEVICRQTQRRRISALFAEPDRIRNLLVPCAFRLRESNLARRAFRTRCALQPLDCPLAEQLMRQVHSAFSSKTIGLAMARQSARMRAVGSASAHGCMQ